MIKPEYTYYHHGQYDKQAYTFLFPEKLTVHRFSMLIAPGYIDVVQKSLNFLNSKFDKKYNEDTKLNTKDFNFLCEHFAGGVVFFVQKYYGKYLLWEERNLTARIKDVQEWLEKVHLTALRNQLEQSNLYRSSDLNIRNFRQFLNVELKMYYRSKPNDDDSYSVYYDIRFFDLNFKKVIDENRGFQISKNYRIHEDNKSFYQATISSIKDEICDYVNLQKRRVLDIDFEKYSQQAINREKLGIDQKLLNEQVKIILLEHGEITGPKLYNHYLIIPQEFKDKGYTLLPNVLHPVLKTPFAE